MSALCVGSDTGELERVVRKVGFILKIVLKIKDTLPAVVEKRARLIRTVPSLLEVRARWVLKWALLLCLEVKELHWGLGQCLWECSSDLCVSAQDSACIEFTQQKALPAFLSQIDS